MNLQDISLCTTELIEALNELHIVTNSNRAAKSVIEGASLIRPVALPPLALNSILILADSSKPEVLNINTDPHHATKIFLNYYPHFHAVHWARLQNLRVYEKFDHDEFCNFFQYRWHSKSPYLMKALLSTPIFFQNYILQKKIKLSDLLFLSTLNDLNSSLELEKYFLRILETQPSYQDLIKSTELVVEILALGKSHELNPTLTEIYSSSHEFIKALSQIRYPESSKIESNKIDLQKKIPWPPFAQVKTARKGDRVGYDVHFFISSEADIIKTVAALERVQSALSPNNPIEITK